MSSSQTPIDPPPSTSPLDQDPNSVADDSPIDTQRPLRRQFNRPPPNLLNPLKRQLSDNMEALIAQAKASKVSQGSTAAQAAKETIYDKLERELTCSICCDLFKDPVTLLNCLHNFCGSCVVPWTQRNDSCPSCRTVIQGCADAFALKPLLEMLLKEKPELAASEDDMKHCQEIYKPGEKVVLRNLGMHDSMEDFVEDDESDEADEDYASSEQDFEDWLPCPCCNPGENADPLYICPDPILDGEHALTGQVEFKQHRRCVTCSLPMPFAPGVDSLRPGSCVLCKTNYCGLLFGPCSQDFRHDYLRHLGATGVYGIGGTGYVPPWFGGNMHEQTSFRLWVESDSNNHTWESLGEDMRDWILQNNNDTIPMPATDPINPITSDSYICTNCIVRVWERYVGEYMITQRDRLGYTDTRPKCWYGKNCRTQRYNSDHCARLNHLCEETPLEERRQAAAPPRRAAQAFRVPDLVAAPAPQVLATLPQAPPVDENMSPAPEPDFAFSPAVTAMDEGDPSPPN
ncbi:hypothetical protein DRE_04430 [Drechslerella stenobrocha 248]|uniref:RING-type domain-containing protein n=1 Tax=Drechslerella stenobrocha 248 TaxID=1043628 RepID=W7HSN5_9PEZI|nr:hypothetical protein DRE_04430 [Drechslerella stenobrocha 248]